MVALLALVACAGPPASGPRAFVAPGRLIESHAALACIACHADATPVVEQAKCQGCHAVSAKGFHASRQVSGKACASCHHDHKGADYDGFGWNSLRGGRAGFDHDLAGWSLEGAHVRASCEGCHRTRSFLGADRRCASCHAAQPHGFERPELLACNRCHTTTAWSPTMRVLDFDHDRETRMPIAGAHGKLACARCHPANRFALQLAEPARCESCHQAPHAAKPYAARACATCHQPASFALIAKFEHARFEAGASHRGLACASCHTDALGGRLPAAACESCHAAKSPHAARFKAFGTPARCGTCHAPTTVGTWKPNRFDHRPWRLDRFHSSSTCRDCHRGATPTDFERLPPGTSCLGCHVHRNVHADDTHPNGRFSNAQCMQCHTL